MSKEEQKKLTRWQKIWHTALFVLGVGGIYAFWFWVTYGGHPPTNAATITTIGDHSYISLNLEGNAAKNASAILHALEQFEKNNLNYRIVSWRIEGRVGTGLSDGYTFGIWIDHERSN